MFLFDKSRKQLDKVSAQLDRVLAVVSVQGGGVYKRIDENRELLQELFEYAPELIKKRYWIAQHFASHDAFFCDIADALPPVHARFMPSSLTSFPRPWPKLGDKEVFDDDVPGEAIRLSPEEWYEIRAALMANIKREAEALPLLAKQFPSMNTKGGVLDRARHSVAIQELVLKKIQEV